MQKGTNIGEMEKNVDRQLLVPVSPLHRSSALSEVLGKAVLGGSGWCEMASSGSWGGPDLGRSLRSAALLGAGIASWAGSSSGSPAKEPQGGAVGRVCSRTWPPLPLTVTGKHCLEVMSGACVSHL